MIDTIQVIDLTLKAVLSIIGVSLSALLYLHHREQRRDAWLRDFRELHKWFWEDEDMAEVRAWLANETSYQTVAPVLTARRDIDERRVAPTEISSEQYMVLEKLDKFCNILTSVQVLDPSFKRHQGLWRRLFVEYWIEEIFSPDRAEIRWYVERFYHDLSTDWREGSDAQRIVGAARARIPTARATEEVAGTNPTLGSRI